MHVVTVLTCLAAGSVAHAAPSDPAKMTLVRMTNPGFVRPGTAVATMCQITEDKVIIIRSLAGVETREERAITWSHDLLQLIDAADAATLEESPYPADAPTMMYSAVLPGNGVQRIVELGSTYDGVRRSNPAPEAMGLRMFIDLHCPALPDHG
jgi:hypothetical protein